MVKFDVHLKKPKFPANDHVGRKVRPTNKLITMIWVGLNARQSYAPWFTDND